MLDDALAVILLLGVPETLRVPVGDGDLVSEAELVGVSEFDAVLVTV